MNKYSSKAVKTAATVGMSLAMVLSNVAPVMAAANAPTPATGACKEGAVTDCFAAYYEINKALGTNSFSEVSMDSIADADVVKLGDNKFNIMRAAVYYYGGFEDEAKSKDNQGTYADKLTEWAKVTKSIVEMFGTAYTTSAEFIDGNNADVADITITNLTDGNLSTWNTNLTSGVWTSDNLKDAANQKTAIKALSDMDKFEDSTSYEVLSEDMMSVFDTLKSTLKAAVKPYTQSDDKVTAEFVEAWNKVLDYDLGQKTGAALTEEEWKAAGLSANITKPVDLSKKQSIQNRINQIKDADNYSRVKNDSAVIEIIAAYQELIDNLGDTKDLLKSDSYTDYIDKKTDDEDVTVKDFLFGDNFGSDGKKANTNTGTLDKAKEVAKVLDTEQLEILKALKEDVLDVAYNFETKKVGNYYLDKGDFNAVITTIQEKELTNNLPAFVYKVVDTKKGTFGIDYVINYVTEAKAALEAVTTDIAKLTPANIKTTDKKTLEAAEDAIYELTATKGKYVGNLTSDQAKEVRKASTKIENLRTAFDNLGTTNVAGWYDMGNGNWGYNNEDGTPAAYKWVASGSDWYMIKDGKMLRNTWLATDGGRWYYLDNAGKMVTNQSVDGCWINSYGVYMSPSYNG
ncbi:hypothetical protein [Dielma fastidiosa]|uniref:Cell wall binding repeat protein n=1 Tax=Dielma fastidiosa TaxID=1034346 RepID=A0AB35UK98_9FIRM|nr:hypothetical protein [Dielma fastidiosa]MDY5168517.1 hypothetical protein [Dielma fastidiosa]